MDKEMKIYKVFERDTISEIESKINHWAKESYVLENFHCSIGAKKSETTYVAVMSKRI